MQTRPGGWMNLARTVTMALCLMTGATQAAAQTYRSVSVDRAGQVSVTSSDGAVFQAPRLQEQVSFSQPAISADHRTLAWLANDPDPTAPPGSTDPIAARLVLYRAGRVLRTFGTDQVFWSWRFASNGEDVAFCTGPAHGGAETCERHRIRSGHLTATWNAHAAGDPPPWAKGLTD